MVNKFFKRSVSILFLVINFIAYASDVVVSGGAAGPGGGPVGPPGGGGVGGPGRKSPIDMYEWYLLAFAVLLLVVYYVYYTKYKKSKSLI